jgi:moderate conductance mechanosensitive channel
MVLERLLRAVATQVQITPAPKVDACGPKGQQSWACSTAYDLSHNKSVAETADALAKPLKIALILLIAYLAVRISRIFIKRVVRHLQDEGTRDKLTEIRRKTGLAHLDTSPTPTIRRMQRAATLGAVLRSIVTVVIWSIAFLLVLGEFDINLTPLLAGAGVIGVALAFGAQSIVRDLLTGIFMLLEDQFGVGDVIDAGSAIGTVEGVSLRTTHLRDVEGVVWHIPNGEIKRVGNKSQQWSRAVLDIAVAYETDIPGAIDVIKRTADGMWRDEAFAGVILDEPEVWGVEELGVDRILIRLVVKTRPLEQWNVARELRARIKAAFDAAGIVMPGTASTPGD